MINRGSRASGVSLVELLIAMAILFIVLAITASAIVQALNVSRVTQDVANTQSKLRRVTEVLTQELRAAVLGGITDLPVASSNNGVSFALLSGDGGIVVRPSTGAWGATSDTNVFASSAGAVDGLLNHPAVMINGARQAMIIPNITHVDTSHTSVSHANCRASIPFDANTRLYRAAPLGFSFDAASGTLFMFTYDGGEARSVPFAFALSRFEISYEYVSESNVLVERNTPWSDASGNPQPIYTDAGEDYVLKRLKLSLASRSESDAVEREYVSYVDLSGLGNDHRPVTSLAPCA